MQYGFLSGGTGTPKLLEGFRQILEDEEIGVICNTGDDHEWFDLHVSPDLDTVLYLFSGKLDLDKYWGVTNETFNALRTLQSLGGEVWFNVGDKDVGLHIFRSSLLTTHTLSEITDIVCEQWNIDAEIAPMSDNKIQSIIHTVEGSMTFQEYFVKHRWKPNVNHVTFNGDTTVASPKATDILKKSPKIIIGPSNPVTSIGPILALPDLRKILKKKRRKVLAVSPIVMDKAFSGPSVKLMQAQGIKISPEGLAMYYEDYLSKLILDPADIVFGDIIQSYNIEPIFMSIELNTMEQKKDLAQSIIEIS